jgi:hypothetical protein
MHSQDMLDETMHHQCVCACVQRDLLGIWVAQHDAPVTPEPPPMHSVTLSPVISRCRPPGTVPISSCTSKNASTCSRVAMKPQYESSLSADMCSRRSMACCSLPLQVVVATLP